MSFSALFIDNFDSFTYNVVHLLASEGAPPDVILNDDARLTPDLLDDYGLLVIGPGPGNPSEQPRMMNVLHAAIDRGMPVFGVCLGLQAIGEALGAVVTHAPSQMHGKTSRISHEGTGPFEGLPAPFTATRYHSLCLAPETLPGSLLVTARSEDGVIQGVSHAHLPVHAVQFHPESVLSEHGARLVRNVLALAGAPVAP
jgi:anthranilate synthase/aminodeoxychorismate synthase-like glutamine amidotransferase